MSAPGGPPAGVGILVIDVGTTGLRAAIVDDTLTVRVMEYRPFPPDVPAPGLVEFDAATMAAKVLDAVSAALAAWGRDVIAVGITNQRASTVVWDRATGTPVGPALGWQDLRTVGECLVANAEHGWSLAPNQSVTKASWLLSHGDVAGKDVCIGTVDSWIAWTMSGGTAHISDQTNASTTTTGMRTIDGTDWNSEICEAFGVPVAALPQVVDSVAVSAAATVVPGTPPIAAIVGDQQASLVGQGCIRPGRAKITFGTGGMLDVCSSESAPTTARRHHSGTYPLPLWSHDGRITWGVEGIMLSAGSNIEWLRDDLGLITTAAESHEVAAACDDTDGVVYVPALLGLGTPRWDYGARGTLLGITRGTTRAHVVRAVLEGIAHRGADLLDAASSATGSTIDTVRIDGGMSRNPTFVQALADASGCAIEVAPVAESTTVGAAFLAGIGVGVWDGIDAIDDLWQPADVVEPRPDSAVISRQRWSAALDRAAGWIPELSALEF